MSRAIKLLACAALFGCDAQAIDSYKGEPLLRMRGEAQLEADRADYEALQPSVAFRDAELRFHLIDVDSQGEFPARFTLDLLEPPPAETILQWTGLPEEQPISIGYITAVTPETPEVFSFGSRMPQRAEPVLDAAGVEWMCAPNMGGCYRYEVVQREGGEVDQLTVCPALDVPLERCQVSYPFEEEMFDDFAGLSENFVVIYLPGAAAPDSVLAHRFGVREEGLAAGYHLFEVRPLTSDEQARVMACSDDAFAMALEQVNAQFDTRFESVDELLEGCADIDNLHNVCLDEEAEALSDFYFLAQLELDCSVDFVSFRHLADPESERINVRIGSNLGLL